MDHWKMTEEAPVCGGGGSVRMFRSSASGLRVALADVGGPVVNGYLCLATEAGDDDGLPHTLEHLVFLGSEQMPYKGVLDLVANRCLSSGTNAWTDTDHTCYTMTTVGSEGFLNMLPVYVEHVLFPTLTEAGYVTEVHHVDGEGEDAGVVYCEMQGRENSDFETVFREAARTLFPGHGYSAQTGGILKNLRESTSHEKVVNFHAKQYRAENLCVLITGGGVEPRQVFEKLKPVEDYLDKKKKEGGRTSEFEARWTTPCPEFKASVEKSVTYPSDEEDNGLVVVAWTGPSADDLETYFAQFCLLAYLTESSVSPLESAFVECADPLASEVDQYVNEQTECVAALIFSNVPLDKVEGVKPLLVETLKKVAADGVDMDRMRVIVSRRVSETLSSAEKSPHDSVSQAVIGSFLYGKGKEDFARRMDITKEYEKLKEKDGAYWNGLLSDLLKKPWCVVKGRPSVDQQKRMAAEEAERVRRQRKALGEDGLAAKKRKLEKAMEENGVEVPKEILEGFTVPSSDSIAFHATELYHAAAGASLPEVFKGGGRLNAPSVFVNAKSNFATVWGIADTSVLPKKALAYLPLLCELITESAVERDGGERMSHAEAVRQMDADLVSRYCAVGTGSSGSYSRSPFSRYLVTALKAERSKYDLAVSWLGDLLHRTAFEWDRVRTVAAKMENGLADVKRSGGIVSDSVHRLVSDSDEGAGFWNNCLVQQGFLRGIAQADASDQEREKVLKILNSVRERLVNTVVVFVSTDFSEVDEPMRAWQASPVHTTKEELAEMPKFVKNSAFNLEPDKQKFRHVLVGLGALESSYVIRTAPGIASQDDPDLPPLLLYFQYLTQLEGPMWCRIRGAGLAYGYGLRAGVQAGRVYLTLTKSTAPEKAFAGAREIMSETLKPGFAWDSMELEAARSSLIFEEVEGLQSVPGAVGHALDAFLHGSEQDVTKQLLKKIMSVEVSDLKRVGEKYVAPLLSADASTTVVLCRPSKLDNVAKKFEKIGVKLDPFANADALASKLL